MIELLYEGTGEEGEACNSVSIKLPKNIRQMGRPVGNRKIYIEDYVVTYLNQLAKPEHTYARGAILLGEYQKDTEQSVLFISGAVEAQNLELDLDETTFTNEVWSEIYQQVKEYFPNLEVVGWFLSRMGFSVELNEKIIRTHMDHFAGRDKTLYLIDSLEQEDAFYLYENGTLTRQNGYYIYYVRNEAMQNYIIEKRGMFVEEEQKEVITKNQRVIQNYRDIIERKTESGKAINYLYVASTCLTVAFLALGITVLHNYDQLKALEINMNRVNLAMEEQEESGNVKKEAPTTIVMNQPANVTTQEPVTQEAASQENQQEETQTETEPTKEAKSEESEENLPVISAGNPIYYTVQDGDTLTSISMQMYHSIAYTSVIMEANGMENGDEIYVGQQIVIPSLNRG